MNPSVGVVVPTRDRLGNLAHLLASLRDQTFDEFTVVVADDGSRDGTREWVTRLAADAPWAGRLVWVGCGRGEIPNSLRARNIGAANLPACVKLLVTLDSDLLLAPQAIAEFWEAHRRWPEAAIFGKVSWLAPGEPFHNASGSVSQTADPQPFTGEVTSIPAVTDLEALVPVGWPPQRVQGTLVGPELRATAPFKPLDGATPVALRPEWGLTINSAMGVAGYWEVGGFDETMPGYGFKDFDFTLRLRAAGVQALFLSAAQAFHVWHPKPAGWELEEQHNLDRLLRRHGRIRNLEAGCDWRLWFHFHRERGARVAAVDGGELWAINASGSRRLRLPDRDWVSRLGYEDAEVLAMAPAELVAVTVAGTAGDLPSVGAGTHAAGERPSETRDRITPCATG